MWAFSFILPLSSATHSDRPLAGMAAVLMYLFITKLLQAHMPWFIPDAGLLLQRHLYLHHYAGILGKRKWPRLSWLTLF